MKEEILNSVKTLTRYFKLRSQVKNDFIFNGFEAKLCKYKKDFMYFMLESDTTLVLWIDRFGIKNLKQLQNETKHVVIVCKSNSPETDKYNRKNNNIELFSLQELQTYIFDNFLVPEIYFLNKNQINEMKEFYGDLSLFPKIKEIDNICRYTNAKEGEIIAFKRKEGTTLRYVL